MKCPNDSTVLTMSERNGIEIDYCPECRGVWLDRGELDKLIEKSAPTTNTHQHSDHSSSYSDRPKEYDRHDDRFYSNNYHKKKRKESFLGDLFNF